MDNTQQIEYWNGEAGARWVEHDEVLEKVLAPITAQLLQRVQPRQGMRALDIGCGCAQQTLALARHLGASGHVTGVDVSAPMLAVAARRTAVPQPDQAPIELLLADAASQAFAAAQFDLLFSRFGVMFFADPEAAFANLRRAAAPGARLLMACWQASARNAWVSLPMRAALRHVPAPAPVDPLAPGPFALADSTRTEGLLRAAGFEAITFEALELELCFAEAPTLAEAVTRLLKVGPVGMLLATQDEQTRARAHREICSEVVDCYRDDRLLFDGAIWLVSASVS